LLHGRRVGVPEPESLSHETRQRSAETGRQAAVVLAFKEVDVEPEVCRRQNRMAEDRVKLLVPDLRSTERVFVVAPSRICPLEVRETQVVLPILERYFQDARLLRCAQVADATVGVAHLDADRTACAAAATSAGN